MSSRSTPMPAFRAVSIDLSKKALDRIILYASPEFLFAPEQFPGGKFPTPLWKQSGTKS